MVAFHQSRKNSTVVHPTKRQNRIRSARKITFYSATASETAPKTRAKYLSKADALIISNETNRRHVETIQL